LKGLPGLEVSVAVDEPAWRKAWRTARADIVEMVARAAAHRKLARRAKGVVAILLTDDATLRRLNRDFRRKDRSTNVLSFADPVEPLGGIAISYQMVKREAKIQGKPFLNHSKHMILHGFLHLLGYDHQLKESARLMEGIETAILKDLGIPNPYVIEKSSA
jgi:probable rRNA maturation factor